MSEPGKPGEMFLKPGPSSFLLRYSSSAIFPGNIHQSINQYIYQSKIQPTITSLTTDSWKKKSSQCNNLYQRKYSSNYFINQSTKKSINNQSII